MSDRGGAFPILGLILRMTHGCPTYELEGPEAGLGLTKGSYAAPVEPAGCLLPSHGSSSPGPNRLRDRWTSPAWNPLCDWIQAKVNTHDQCKVFLFKPLCVRLRGCYEMP